jgi:hypothetical protein
VGASCYFHLGVVTGVHDAYVTRSAHLCDTRSTTPLAVHLDPTVMHGSPRLVAACPSLKTALTRQGNLNLIKNQVHGSECVPVGAKMRIRRCLAACTSILAYMHIIENVAFRDVGNDYPLIVGGFTIARRAFRSFMQNLRIYSHALADVACSVGRRVASPYGSTTRSPRIELSTLY